MQEKKCQEDLQVLVTQLKNRQGGVHTALRGFCERGRESCQPALGLVGSFSRFQLRKHSCEDRRSSEAAAAYIPPPEAGLAQTSPDAELRLEQRKQRLGTTTAGWGWGCSHRALRPQDPQPTDTHTFQGLSSRNNHQLSMLKQNKTTEHCHQISLSSFPNQHY